MNLKHFIEDNLNLIAKNNFTELYKRANGTIRNYEVCNLTEFLLSCDIDPLPYMNEIPDYYLSRSDISEIKIPNTIKNIGYSAFTYCQNLTEVTISNSVNNIADWAFSDCSSLKSVVIGNNVARIGYGAFNGCSSLISVSIGKGIKTIKGNAFSKCINLIEIVIPDSVEVMEDFVFWGCKNLKKITLPKSIKIIKEIFYNCFSLTDIYYEGSEEDWNKINLEECIIPENVKIHFKG